MSEQQTLMAKEAAEAPARAALQLQRNSAAVASAVERLRALDPPFAVTLARGSSDHAAGFAKHLFEATLRLPTLSQPPSLASLYRATSPRLHGALVLAISQSGRSPDLIESAIAARGAGALLVVMVNDETSPLAQEADILLPLHAGEERSVAATKSFIASLVGIADLVGRWGDDSQLVAGLERIEPLLASAGTMPWDEAIEPLAHIQRLLVLGRGPTAPIAAEAALKLKETSQIHAEAFSSAEVAHGPMALVSESDPVFALMPSDAAAEGFSERLAWLAERGAQVIAAGLEGDAVPGAIHLPAYSSGHAALDAIAMAQGFYHFAECLARRRGLDPDHPPHLSKVTRTR